MKISTTTKKNIFRSIHTQNCRIFTVDSDTIRHATNKSIKIHFFNSRHSCHLDVFSNISQYRFMCHQLETVSTLTFFMETVYYIFSKRIQRVSRWTGIIYPLFLCDVHTEWCCRFLTYINRDISVEFHSNFMNDFVWRVFANKKTYENNFFCMLNKWETTRSMLTFTLPTHGNWLKLETERNIRKVNTLKSSLSLTRKILLTS